MTARWTFRPPIWAVLGTVLGCALTIKLGFWQWQRGTAREALDAQYANAGTETPLDLRADSRLPAGVDARAATASGHYDGARQLLLDNQVNDRTPGYQVLTPFVLDSGGIVLVNRGWLPQNPDRRVLPALELSAGPVVVHGLWRALPQPALRLSIDNCATSDTPWPRIVGYPTAADLRCLYGDNTAAGELLLAPEAADGYVRNWTQSDRRFPPSRHYGYAAQWFAFAATLLVIFLKLNLKRRP